MGFLSRKTKDQPKPETNGGPPAVAEELEELEAAVDKGEETSPSADATPPEKEEGSAESKDAAARSVSAEGASTSPPSDAPEATTDSPSSEVAEKKALDPKLAEKMAEKDESDEKPRMKAAELIAPSRSDSAAEDKETERRMQVYVFANQKGGVAKTTTTLNLAVAFKESGHDVLAIDLDPQGNLTMSQGIDPDQVDKSLYDVLVHDMPISEVIQEREIDIAVASIDLAGAEIAMSTKIGRERSLEKALKEVQGDYDFVCIDTPPSLGLLTVNALTAADKVIVPVQCEYLSMRGLVQLQNTLKMIQENLNPDVEIEGILPTMLDSRTVHAKEAVEILEENFGDLVFKSRIRKAIKFAEAPVRGSSVLKYDPDGNAANYYRELAKEVLTHGSSE
jgi:chromosome partitioning protein